MAWYDHHGMIVFMPTMHQASSSRSAKETSRNITSRVIEHDISGEIYFLEDSEGSELANMVANYAKMVAKVANLLAKNDTNLALPPRFRQVLIESPL
ncbi:hypothetical protein TNCV_4590131 [Trichonephila clavipes]|nr:hypothetical protein TNCV_4590131 [Trichonephila clavipes]